MRAETDVTSPSLLVTDEQWDDGWTVTVDGHAAHVARADNFFTAVALDPGHHTVVWTYHAPGLRLGLLLFALGIVACAAIAADSPARIRRLTRARSSVPPT
jgi:uncharacterized membrane protein YfhO